jgi:hypothetical protein
LVHPAMQVSTGPHIGHHPHRSQDEKGYHQLLMAHGRDKQANFLGGQWFIWCFI